MTKTGHPRYYEIVASMAELYEKKAQDYSGEKPFSDLKLSRQIGIPPWKGVIVRMLHKFGRIKQACRVENSCTGETVIDTLMDIANYCIIAIILFEEETKEQ